MYTSLTSPYYTHVEVPLQPRAQGCRSYQKKFQLQTQPLLSTPHQPAHPSKMADVDEDAQLKPQHPNSSEDNDLTDETQDFRFLASLTSKSGTLPKRGEKDFEPHGTKHQDGVLEASRQAMHDALDYTRIHIDKGYIRGFYYGEEGVGRDEVVPGEWTQGLEDDHVVVLESARSTLFKTMGQTSRGKARSSMWLLPEEALYLVERGNLDLWWPGRDSFRGVAVEKIAKEAGGEEEVENEEELDEGTPMSLQAAYAMFIGEDGEKGKVSLERYTVYANLKRMGYVVFRAPEWDPSKPGEVQKYEAAPTSTSIFNWLFGNFFAAKEIEHASYGPLVKPGMYRSYNAIYRHLAIIPRHTPSPIPNPAAPPPSDPYRVVFLLWKPSRIPSFAKSSPGLPDFRIAVVDARVHSIPTLGEVSSLLESTPWDAPDVESQAWKGPGKLYQRLKQGARSVVLAVVDRGVVSYLRVGEGGFAGEEIFGRFDRNNNHSTKRGGGRGRGRGRGGRGRGGGGRGS